MKQQLTPGTVVLVGGGPGDPDLITVAGLRAVRQADVVLYDRLAPLAVLDEMRPDAERIAVGKIPRGACTPQERINEILIERARAGRTVVRLKGGDNYVFGRGGEEAQACALAGVPVDVIPGVTSAVAVPALAGVPVTHRSLSQGFTVVSGHVPPGDPRSTVAWEAAGRQRCVTLQLDTHFLAPARTGDFVEARGAVMHRTNSTLFMQGHLSVAGQPVASAQAIMRVVLIQS